MADGENRSLKVILSYLHSSALYHQHPKHYWLSIPISSLHKGMNKYVRKSSLGKYPGSES